MSSEFTITNYILGADGKTPIPIDITNPDDLRRWGAFMFGEFFERRVVGKDEFTDKETSESVEVSTVFLGLDHGYGMTERPILWETMIFGGAHDENCERYSTWEEAKRGHAVWCKIAQGMSSKEARRERRLIVLPKKDDEQEDS
jgi:hypothetical protein